MIRSHGPIFLLATYPRPIGSITMKPMEKPNVIKHIINHPKNHHVYGWYKPSPVVVSRFIGSRFWGAHIKPMVNPRIIHQIGFPHVDQL